jgi:hypothetical protein
MTYLLTQSSLQSQNAMGEALAKLSFVGSRSEMLLLFPSL